MNILNKINIINIVKSHFRTIKNANTGKPDWDDYFTFLFFPLIIALILGSFRITLTSEATNIIISTLSIFVGLMFNIIVLIFDIVKRDASKKIKNQILKQLLDNISFAIILSIISILSTLFTYSKISIINIVFSIISFFLLSLFLVTLLMILKRMHNVFKNEIDELESQN